MDNGEHGRSEEKRLFKGQTLIGKWKTGEIWKGDNLVVWMKNEVISRRNSQAVRKIHV